MKYIFIVFGILYINVLVSQNTETVTTTPSYTNTPQKQKEYESFEDRLYYGGNVGASFGTRTFVNLSPLVGCHITKKFSVGLGAIYNYYSIAQNGIKYSTSIYGANTFARYNVLDNLFLQAGWDRINVPNYSNFAVKDARAWTDNILVGGGYRQPIGGNGSITAMIFYNINETPLSPYQNPIIQMGFNIGL